MNVVLAVAVLTGLYMVKYRESGGSGRLGGGLCDSRFAGSKSGYHDGDQVVKLERESNPNWEDIVTQGNPNARRPDDVMMERDGQSVPADPHAGDG